MKKLLEKIPDKEFFVGSAITIVLSQIFLSFMLSKESLCYFLLFSIFCSVAVYLADLLGELWVANQFKKVSIGIVVLLVLIIVASVCMCQVLC